MFRKSLAALAVSAATIIAFPALAAPGGGGGPRGGGAGASANTGSMAGMNSQGALHSSPNSAINRDTTTNTNASGTTNYSTNSQGAANSQGLQHASPTGIAHANQNSVLARGSMPGTTLPGLTTGLTVNNSGGTSIGTVTQVISGPSGTVRAVVVTESNGQTVTLPANSLTISGGVVTTTSTTVGG
jgi:hypothetical protein